MSPGERGSPRPPPATRGHWRGLAGFGRGLAVALAVAWPWPSAVAWRWPSSPRAGAVSRPQGEGVGSGRAGAFGRGDGGPWPPGRSRPRPVGHCGRCRAGKCCPRNDRHPGRRVPVVELEPMTRPASSSLPVHVPAPAAVSLIHRSLHGRRDLACRGGHAGLREPLPRVGHAGEAPRLQPFHLLRDRRLDERGEVAVGHLRAHEDLQPLQLVAEPSRGGELDLEAGRGQGLDAPGPDGDRGRILLRRQRRRKYGQRRRNCVWTEYAPSRAGQRQWFSLLRGGARCGSDRGRPRRQLLTRVGASGRERTRDQLLDLPLGPVGGSRKESWRILAGEVRCQFADAGQVKPSIRQHVEEQRMLARGPGRRDAQVGLRLGEVEGLGAVANIDGKASRA